HLSAQSRAPPTVHLPPPVAERRSHRLGSALHQSQRHRRLQPARRASFPGEDNVARPDNGTAVRGPDRNAQHDDDVHALTARRPFCRWCVAAMLVMTGAATAQDYPSKPIRIVTSEFGSATDLTARLLGSVMSSSLGRQVVVENRGFIAIEVVAKANADGYTVLCYGPPLWLAPLMRSVSYDLFKDFAPVTMAVTTPNVLVVHPALPVKSVGDLIALAKARPGELNYGSGSPGSSTHMAAEL